MAIQHVAGSRLFFGSGAGVADSGPLVTSFVVKQQKDIVDRTGIGHTRRNRHDAGLRDAGFDLAGFLDPAAFGDDRALLEDLIAAAFNDAVHRVEAKQKEHMGSLAKGMNLPGGVKLPF